MASYNEIDGIPSHANNWLLNGVLRGEWGYQGAVVSDYYGIRELVTRHKLYSQVKDAAERAIKSGVDIETPDPESYAHLPELVRDGRLPMALVDQAVRRVLTLKFEAGLFENPYPDVATADARTATPDAIALARDAADQAVVLLKNDSGLLPLNSSKIHRLAVLGTHANDTPIGGYSDVPRHVVSVLEGIREAGQGKFTVDYSEGVRLIESRCWSCDEVKLVPESVNQKLIAAAVQTA
jgi:beta-glucosidase